MNHNTNLKFKPIQVEGLADSANEALISESTQQSKKLKFRPRSISPHARRGRGSNILFSAFSRSRSLSRSRLRTNDDDDSSSVSSVDSTSSSGSRAGKQVLIAVTSCRSDAYYSQKAPGSTSMLPRKAPSALKTFHELAVGVKDAYEAVGATPKKPDPLSDEFSQTPLDEMEGHSVLWQFMENIRLLLGLVDEVASDTATRGALKDDNAFRGIRDVIKKCNKILEKMLIRRENKYTLFFRIIEVHNLKEISRMKSWNTKLEKSIGSFANRTGPSSNTTNEEKFSDGSLRSDKNDESGSGRVGIFRRVMPQRVGRSRNRRATPTPKMRNRFRNESNNTTSSGDDGYATATPPMTSGNLAKLQQSLSNRDESPLSIPGKFAGSSSSNVAPPSVLPMKPKDELVDVIRSLQSEKENRENISSANVQPEEMKSDRQPMADLPSSIPKLPTEYIHRHRLMKQVVNSLLDRPPTGSRADTEVKSKKIIITSITSRHADKAGNGKTTLAVAALQTIEVRQTFIDGIAWIQVGRMPLTEKDVRRLYEELYDQIVGSKNTQKDCNNVKHSSRNQISERSASDFAFPSEKDESGVSLLSDNSEVAHEIVKSRNRHYGGELEGMKEDLGRVLSKKRILLVLDDVWRLDDAKRFIFDKMDGEQSNQPKATSGNNNQNEAGSMNLQSYRILITTRTPGLFGSQCNEVFVRIFSEQEAVKLLLYSAGRRLNGGKSSPVFNEARVIVKGCGNSPLALRLAGGMLRTNNRNWTLSSITWRSLVNQCRCSLDEASKIRSFVNSVLRIVDLSFFSVQDLDVRVSLRMCFVTFAMAFHYNDWVLSGKGIPREVVLNLFAGMMNSKDGLVTSPDDMLDMMVHLNLLQRIRRDAKLFSTQIQSTQNIPIRASSKSLFNGSMTISDNASRGNVDTNRMIGAKAGDNISYLMHESIKHIAEEMSTRSSPFFAPKPDDFTSFAREIESERIREMKVQSRHWLSSAANYLFSTPNSGDSTDTMSDHQFHELMASSLSGSGMIPIVFNESRQNNLKPQGGVMVEKYIVTFLPSHFIHAKMHSKGGNLLIDDEFVKCRVAVLGCVEACRRHVADLLDLRQEYNRLGNVIGVSPYESNGDNPTLSNNDIGMAQDISCGVDGSERNLDLDSIQQKASHILINTVFGVERNSSSSDETINMAICLATMGECFSKSLQSRDAIVQLKKGIDIYSRLGGYRIDVAMLLTSLAKVYARLEDRETALIKLMEAEKIYESCNATMFSNSISNSQLMACLFIDNANWEKAIAKYNDIIRVRVLVYGSNSLPVARIINDYAVVLAKHGKLSEALQQYENSRRIYEVLSSQDSLDTNEGVGAFSFDVTLLDLNIASIKTKIGDYQSALNSYEKGVAGLRITLEKESRMDRVDASKTAAQRRHLVSAIGRIGSLKMKLRDNNGALEAYLMLLKEVNKTSPTPSQLEKAKAHVKCATIFRQMSNIEGNINAVAHLKQAFHMYTHLHGPDHKDTKAIASSLRQWQKMDAGLS